MWLWGPTLTLAHERNTIVFSVIGRIIKIGHVAACCIAPVQHPTYRHIHWSCVVKFHDIKARFPLHHIAVSTPWVGARLHDNTSDADWSSRAEPIDKQSNDDQRRTGDASQA